jgi:hypothetical protein
MPRAAAFQRILLTASRRASAAEQSTAKALAELNPFGQQSVRGLRTLAGKGASIGNVSVSNKHNGDCPCTLCSKRSVQTAAKADCPNLNIAQRHKMMLNHFPSAMGVDDFMARVEMALAGYGFTGDNSIGKHQLMCRNASVLMPVCVVLR